MIKKQLPLKQTNQYKEISFEKNPNLLFFYEKNKEIKKIIQQIKLKEEKRNFTFLDYKKIHHLSVPVFLMKDVWEVKNKDKVSFKKIKYFFEKNSLKNIMFKPLFLFTKIQKAQLIILIIDFCKLNNVFIKNLNKLVSPKWENSFYKQANKVIKNKTIIFLEKNYYSSKLKISNKVESWNGGNNER